MFCFTVLCSQKHESLCIDEGVNPGHNMVELLLNGTRQHFCTDYHASVKFVIKEYFPCTRIFCLLGLLMQSSQQGTNRSHDNPSLLFCFSLFSISLELHNGLIQCHRAAELCWAVCPASAV